MTAQQKETLQKYGPFLALIAVCIGLAFMSPNFLSVSNSFDVMRQVSINAVIAFGMTLTILLGGIDLSVGSILAVSSVLAAMTMKGGHGAGPAVGNCDPGRRRDGIAERRRHCQGQRRAVHRDARHDDIAPRGGAGALERQPDQRLLERDSSRCWAAATSLG